ncbi:hypothetical protein DWG18_06855 [Lysobacter sp. TY2-98]|uniref:hypothetical protein n=1 Tax=Lysobacter sp. TY2-98 TaxID=2290922 RepID=UPI000E20C10F|nr:hypothetical protein [Lysobacter sp. TY2-98]AXK72027.1 hypothetical protein DWG18_06855 [Lysobacter sp. TY2-98]
MNASSPPAGAVNPNRRPRTDWVTTALVGATLLTLGGTLVWLRGAGYLHIGGTFPSLDELNKIGGFVGGLLAPVVVAWAARSFYLQRQQLIDTIEVARTQIDVQKEANIQYAADLAMQKEQRREERAAEEYRTAPKFDILAGGISSDAHNGREILSFAAVNVGHTGNGLEIRVVALGNPSRLLARPRFDGLHPHGARLEFNVAVAAGERPTLGEHGLTILIRSERTDGRHVFEKLLADTQLADFDLVEFVPVDSEGRYKRDWVEL